MRFLIVVLLVLMGCSTQGKKESKDGWKIIEKTMASACAPLGGSGSATDAVAGTVEDIRVSAAGNHLRSERFLEMMEKGETSPRQHEAFIKAMISAWARQSLLVEDLIEALIRWRRDLED